MNLIDDLQSAIEAARSDAPDRAGSLRFFTMTKVCDIRFMKEMTEVTYEDGNTVTKTRFDYADETEYFGEKRSFDVAKEIADYLSTLDINWSNYAWLRPERSG